MKLMQLEKIIWKTPKKVLPPPLTRYRVLARFPYFVVHKIGEIKKIRGDLRRIVPKKYTHYCTAHGHSDYLGRSSLRYQHRKHKYCYCL